MQRVAYQLEDRRDQLPDLKGSRNCFLLPFSRGDGIVLSASLMVNRSHVYSVAELLCYSYQALTSEQTLHHKVLNQYVLTQKEISHRGWFSWFVSLTDFSLQTTQKQSLFQKELRKYLRQAGSVILEELSFLSQEGHQITCPLQQKYIFLDAFLCVNCSKKCDVKYFVSIRRLIKENFCVLSLSLAKCCLYLSLQIHKSLQYCLKKNRIYKSLQHSLYDYSISIHCRIMNSEIFQYSIQSTKELCCGFFQVGGGTDQY